MRMTNKRLSRARSGILLTATVPFLCGLGGVPAASQAQGPRPLKLPVATPPAYKTAAGMPRRAVASRAAVLGRADWWTLFGDPVLSELEVRAVRANQNVLQAIARIEEERLRARAAGADFLPRLEANLSASRIRNSDNLPRQRGELIGGFPGVPATDNNSNDGPAIISTQPRTQTVNDFRAPLTASYELDVFGRIRHAYGNARALAQAAEADARGVLLSLAGDVAANYFQLRALDRQAGILERSLGLRREQVRLTRERLDAGVSDPLDLERARTEEANTQADIADNHRQRANVENALAALCGEAASEFSIPARSTEDRPPPAIPAGVPAELLAHRPDVAQAERQAAAAVENIGLVRAQGLPVFRVQGSVALESSDYQHVFDAQSRDLRVMPTVDIPIFEGGRNEANLRTARAVYQQAAASYRNVVLVAYRDAESALADLRGRSVQAAAQARAAQSAQHVLDLTNDRYRRGAVNYFDVVDAERSLLAIQLGADRTLNFRYTATVALVRALGGGWNASPAEMTTRRPSGAATKRTISPRVLDEGLLLQP